MTLKSPKAASSAAVFSAYANSATTLGWLATIWQLSMGPVMGSRDQVRTAFQTENGQGNVRSGNFGLSGRGSNMSIKGARSLAQGARYRRERLSKSVLQW
jgi:hypothetical protein